MDIISLTKILLTCDAPYTLFRTKLLYIHVTRAVIILPRLPLGNEAGQTRDKGEDDSRRNRPVDGLRASPRDKHDCYDR